MKRVVFLGTKDLKLGINSRFEFYVGHQNGPNFENDKIMNDLYIKLFHVLLVQYFGTLIWYENSL